MFNFLPSFKPFESLFRFLSQFDFWQVFLEYCQNFKGLNQAMIIKIAKATDDTIYMLFMSGLWGIIIGLPIGILLYTTRKGQILDSKIINFILSTIINLFRSIPYIIFIVWIIPFTKVIMATLTQEYTFIGKHAAIVPLSLGVAPLVARMIENALLDLPSGLTEASRSMGAKPMQIIRKVLLPEAFPVIANSMTITLITLTGYIAMMGATFAGGLGDLAIQEGYNNNNPAVLNICIVLLMIIIFLIQYFGNTIVKRSTHS